MGFAKREVNLAVIAHKLGISISTVSRALRGASSIHPTTRERVLEEARTLGYLGSQRASGAHKARNVLLLSQARQSGLDGVYMAGLSRAAVALNVSLISHHFMPEDCLSVLEPALQPMAMKSGDTCGVVLLHRWPEEVVRKLSKSMPTVSILHFYVGACVDLIGIEDRVGMYELIEHLVANGCSRIGFFGFSPLVSWSRSRLGAYVEALAVHGLPFRGEDVISATLEEASSAALVERPSGGAAAASLTREGVHAWVCSSQMLGYSLFQYLQKKGFKIPSDVSLTGFHGGEQGQPPGLPLLTTTAFNSEELGIAALRRLIFRAESPQESCRSILFPCNLQQGESTVLARS